HGGLAGNERDVRHDPGKPFAFGRLEVREHRDPTDLLPRHHGRHRRPSPSSLPQSMPGTPETPHKRSISVRLNAGTTLAAPLSSAGRLIRGATRGVLTSARSIVSAIGTRHSSWRSAFLCHGWFQFGLRANPSDPAR